MKITWTCGSHSVEFEHRPMPERHFKSVCRLVGAAIGGIVLVALVHMLGIWGLVWPLAGLALVGVFKLLVESLID